MTQRGIASRTAGTAATRAGSSTEHSFASAPGAEEPALGPPLGKDAFVLDVNVAVERLIPIQHRGTVLVGTIVAGSIRVGDRFEFRGIVAECTAIEIGRALLDVASEGDRVGILLNASFPCRPRTSRGGADESKLPRPQKK